MDRTLAHGKRDEMRKTDAGVSRRRRRGCGMRGKQGTFFIVISSLLNAWHQASFQRRLGEEERRRRQS